MKIHIVTRGGEECDVIAKAVELFGFKEFGIHRELEHNLMSDDLALKPTGECFVVTNVATGLSLGRGPTKQDAIEKAKQYIAQKAVERDLTPEALLQRTLAWIKADPGAPLKLAQEKAKAGASK